MTEEKKQVPMDLDVDVSELVTNFSKATKTDKSAAIRKAFAILMEKGKDAEKEIVEYEGMSKLIAGQGMDPKDPIDKLIQYSLAEKALGKKEKKEDGIDLNKLMAFATIKQMLAPDPQQLMMMEKLGDKKGGANDDMMKMWIEQQNQNQQMMMQMMFGKTNELKSQIKDSKKEAETRENRQADMFIQTLQRLENSYKEGGTLEQGFKKYSAFRNMFMEMAKEEGLKKENIVSEEGKINWGQFGEKMLDVIQTGIQKLPKGTPPMKEVQTISELAPPITRSPAQLPLAPEPEPVQTSYPNLVQISEQAGKKKTIPATVEAQPIKQKEIKPEPPMVNHGSKERTTGSVQQ